MDFITNIVNTRNTILKGFTNADDLLEKGKKGNIGEIREWSGKKYKKQANGKWMQVSEYGKTKSEHEKHKREWGKSAERNEENPIKLEEIKKEFDRHVNAQKDLDDKEYDDSHFEEKKETREEVKERAFNEGQSEKMAEETAKNWEKEKLSKHKELYNKADKEYNDAHKAHSEKTNQLYEQFHQKKEEHLKQSPKVTEYLNRGQEGEDEYNKKHKEWSDKYDEIFSNHNNAIKELDAAHTKNIEEISSRKVKHMKDYFDSKNEK